MVDSVVLLLACSVLEEMVGSGSDGAAGPPAVWPGQGLLLLLGARDWPDGEDGGGA